MDVYLEVSDEIAGQLDRFKLDEEAHRVRILRAKAYFSLNRGDGIEKDALQKPPQPLELLLKAEQAERLNAALRSLSERQRRRLLAFYLDGKNKSQIAKEENVSEGSIRESIRSGLAQLKKSLKNF
ncbi:MAG: sigma-70 family RNA polymerase sigma factor [Oscillospiraceae bacterium]